MEIFASPAFFIALGNIVLVNIVLSGDNALVIALASRSLPKHQQRKAIFYGSAAAILMRVALTIFALRLLSLPYLKIVGAVLLFYIAVQLLQSDDGESEILSHSALWSAVRTILVADLVMSLDNVLGVAVAANGNVTLLALGLAISIPLIAFGSSLILNLMEKLPFIIVCAAALLGYLAGEMLFADPALHAFIQEWLPHHELFISSFNAHVSGPGAFCASAVVVTGNWMARKTPDKRR
jgi:YjbE family integral membrane protein